MQQVHKIHRSQAATRPVLVRCSKKGVRINCLYKPHEQHHAPLERPKALALGLERAAAASAAVDSIGHIGSLQRVGAPQRLRVAVDVDEVLGRFVYALNGFCESQYGMSYQVSDYWVYEFAKIWGCSQERSNHIVHEFFKSPHFNDGIPIIPDAYETLQRIHKWCDLMVVTSRQHVIQDATLDWIDKHYPGTFQEVYFGNHFALEGTSRKKSDICASIGAHVLIDDNVGYAMDCASNGIRVLLYDWEGSYPWSKLPSGSEHPNIQIVRSWQEVEQALVAMVPSSRL